MDQNPRAPAFATSYVLADLPDLSARSVAVVAIDAAGNESAPLEATATTPDVTAPAFPDDAVLDVVPRGGTEGGPPSSVALDWQEASDATGVARYDVTATSGATGTTTDTFLLLDGAVPAEGATYELVAIDAAGNRSLPLRATVSGAPLPPREPVRSGGVRPGAAGAVAETNRRAAALLDALDPAGGAWLEPHEGDVLTDEIGAARTSPRGGSVRLPRDEDATAP